MSPDQKKDKKKPSVLDQWRSRKKGSVRKVISPKPEDQIARPSSGQHRLWLLQQLYPKNTFYQYGHLYKIKGKLDIERLNQSFQKIIDRHEILRTNFEETANGVELKLNPSPTFQMNVINLSSLETTEQQAEADKIIKAETSRKFDLADGLLMRINLLQFSETEHWMVLSIHHIIGDRSSLLLLNDELFSYYETLGKEEEITAKPLPIQYSDYAYWKNNQKTDEKQLDYWLNHLKGELALLSLPTDYTRPKNATFRGATISRNLNAELSEKLQQLAKQNNTTLYNVMLTAFKILLYRYTHQTDLIVGSPFSNRDKTELEKLIGFFNETLVLRTQLSDNISFEDCIQKVKETTIKAFEHKHVSFDELVQKIQPTRHGSMNPLFQAMFVFNNAHVPQYADLDIQIEEKALDLGVSKFDLTLFANKHEQHLELALEFSLDLFEEETIERMLRHLEVILESVAQDASQLISKIPVLDAAERNRILVEWNDTKIAPSKEKGIHHLIEKIAASYPKQIAASFQNQQLTYEQLNQQANNIAAHLVNIGVQSNTLVGLYTERSLEMVIGILGILKAGAAYLPLDPKYPSERIEYMLKDAEVSFVLTKDTIKDQFPTDSIQIIEIKKAINSNHTYQPVEMDDSQLAYLIYTSGSSGKPKGVPISHRNLLHSTTSRFQYFKNQPSAFLLLSSFSFDSSIVGIFWTLCSGGTLVLPANRIEQDIRALAQLIKANHISHTLLLPSLYRLLLEYAAVSDLSSLNTVMVAGEASSAALIQQHYKKIPRVELVNEYGPTEGTVWCTAHKILPEDAFGMVPIGRPIPNVQNYILDQNLEPVPVGVIGELYIGGAGVATGYWKRPKLTSERFVPNHFDKNASPNLYKTGDLVRYRANGLIDFLGRADHQVKIRGHRIELDEVKKVLTQLKIVQDAVVIVQNENNLPRLIAYLAIRDSEKDLDIRFLLKEKLPEYMIPSAFVILAEFPKLPNGKINLSKLPTPDKTDFSGNTGFKAPKTEIEQELAKIWEKVLKITPIGIHDNFFEIGGDSMRSIQVIAKAQEVGLEIASHQLFEYQTIGELAKFLEKSEDSEAADNWSSLVSLNKSGAKSPLFCIHSGGGHVFFYQPLAKHLSADQPLYALQPLGLNGEETLHSSIEEMATFYLNEMKKVQPSGPYHILGTCFSNAVGLEMANQLKAAGEEIALLLFIDSGPAYLEGAAIRGERKTMSRFMEMIKDGNWKGIQRKFRNRWIRTKQKALSPLENQQETNLRVTINSLNHLYNYYNWTPYDGKITFIRSTEFAEREDKKTHISQWTKLAKGGLEVHVVPGHHLTLFAEPEVQGLAIKIEECLQALNI